MDFFDRFREAFSKANIELAASLPFCDRNQEYLFFYSTDATAYNLFNHNNILKEQNAAFEQEKEGYSFEDLKYICTRNLVTGKIVEYSKDEFDLRNVDWEKKLIVPKIKDEEAINAEDKYEELYETFVNEPFLIAPNTIQQETYRELWRLFNLLVPESCLRHIYMGLGKEFFDYLQVYS